jgi:hypothetical protein
MVIKADEERVGKLKTGESYPRTAKAQYAADSADVGSATR